MRGTDGVRDAQRRQRRFIPAHAGNSGSGEKDRRQPLWTGRQLRPACHATQTKGEVLWPRRKLKEQPSKMSGARALLALLPRSALGRVRALPDPGSRAATADFRGNTMCVVLRSSRQTDEASIPCSARRDFERPLNGSPIAWILTARPSPASCQLRPMQSGGRRTSLATHDRCAELRVRQSEE